jgi:hypothetical protein
VTQLLRTDLLCMLVRFHGPQNMSRSPAAGRVGLGCCSQTLGGEQDKPFDTLRVVDSRVRYLLNVAKLVGFGFAVSAELC